MDGRRREDGDRRTAGIAIDPDRVVRRYDLEPFLVSDFLTDTSTGRADTLHPDPFHQLLCKRIALLE